MRRYACPWDDGITWYSGVSVPADDLPLEVAFVRDQILRTVNDGFDDGALEQWIRAATEECERRGYALMPQTCTLTLSGFPCREIVLPRLPVLTGDAHPIVVTYVDGDGETQTLDADTYRLVPSGTYARGKLVLMPSASWPSTRCQPDAVLVTYDAGYDDEDTIPATLRTGIALRVGELYKQRSLSVIGDQVSPSGLRLEDFWPEIH